MMSHWLHWTKQAVPMDSHQRVLSYGIFFPGLFSLIGWLAGDAIRAL